MTGRRHLHGGAVSHGLVGVDALAQLLAVKEVGQQLLHLGDARAAADQHNVVHSGLVHLSVTQHLPVAESDTQALRTVRSQLRTVPLRAPDISQNGSCIK